MLVIEAANRLQVTEQYVRRLIAYGKLIATQNGRQWEISEEDLEQYIINSNHVIDPEDRAFSGERLPDIIALSFFSGAMGLDIGMGMGGIEATLACEFDKCCRRTIVENKPSIGLIGDINNYSVEEILRMAGIPEGRNVDIIFGGPPCQAFSSAGNMEGLEDIRGNVFLKYLDIIEQIQPTYFVIENVRGLLTIPYSLDELASDESLAGGVLYLILNRITNMGYTYSFDLYNAANFGTPQSRERLIIIGKRGTGKVNYLVPTHSDNEVFGLPRWRTFRDAVANINSREYRTYNDERAHLFSLVPPGGYWADLPPKLHQRAMGAKLQLSGGKTGFFRRVDWDKPCPTLVTDPTMPATDLCHPEEVRTLSVEEYRAIQEFPSEWYLAGDISAKYKQLGNAVPIRLGRSVAEAIIRDLNGEEADIPEGFKYSRYNNTNDITWTSWMAEKISNAQTILEARNKLYKFKRKIIGDWAKEIALSEGIELRQANRRMINLVNDILQCELTSKKDIAKLSFKELKRVFGKYCLLDEQKCEFFCEIEKKLMDIDKKISDKSIKLLDEKIKEIK